MWKLLDEQGEVRGKVGERERRCEGTEPTRRAGEGAHPRMSHTSNGSSVRWAEHVIAEGNKSWGRVRKGFRPGSSSRGRTVGGGRRCCLWFGWFGAAGDRASRCIRVG